MMGNRTWLIWLVASACSAVVLLAMSVVTLRFVEQSNDTVRQGADAYLEERVRLAMWRLDTLATSIVGTEDARPAEELFTKDYRDKVQSQAIDFVPVASIYAKAPAYINIYWSVDLGQKQPEVLSPQVYEETYLVGHRVSLAANHKYSKKLERLNELLRAPAGDKKGEFESNLDLVCMTCLVLPFPKALDVEGGDQAQVLVQKDDNNFSLDYLNKQAPTKQKNSKVVQYKNAPEVQQKISKVEKSKRQKSVERLAGNVVNYSQWNANPLQSQSESNADRQVFTPEMTAFAPVWIEDELVLVRRVRVMGREMLQGIWLKKQEIVKQLLDEVSDLFPTANLEPYLDKIDGSTTENVMLKLPFILIPQQHSYSSVDVSARDVVDGPIGFAWLGVGFALVAGFFMLRGVIKMSERRAAFVSSVTHELRTPLTTFRLYSDMLSSGLVKEPITQQKYLETLRTESERLTHLVENVLSYSQIERGGVASKKSEELSLRDLIERSTDRLENRALGAGMKLQVQMSEFDAARRILVNTTTVEQILFNLVDNAAKYACDGGKVISVTAEFHKHNLRIAVCDQGQGVCRGQRGRLFKPFHKTSEQAASTKPGVGLGLALCRRLARAMKGDLVYEKIDKGACFVLKVPSNLKNNR
ncbi:MAG: HAMP domain-containing sensor histidine kinase [Rubritalea sp.]|uniref:sensor histidine kinase n=1 Tax=Rubritalea sp. TaxID=2109375 RepID=UPI0032420E27